MPLLPWTISTSQSVYTTRVFSLHQHHATSQLNPGKQGLFSVLEAPDWVNVIAITTEQKVVMIRQFRQGTRDITLEIPGGMVDAGEDFLTAGLRELKEETGGVGGDALQIGMVAPNPAIQSNHCATILVKDVVLGELFLDGNEEIEVILYPLSDVSRLIREGEITHSLVIAAFHHYHLHCTHP
jgi:ADP-ribose pyrophosphatase